VAGVNASLEAIAGSLGACARESFGGWSIAACARVELGVVRGTSSGAYRDGTATAPYYAAGPALVLTAPLFGTAHARLESGLDVTLDPPRFVLRDFGEIYRVSRFIPSISLGFDVELVAR
jgi:hypothetical protein